MINKVFLLRKHYFSLIKLKMAKNWLKMAKNWLKMAKNRIKILKKNENSHNSLIKVIKMIFDKKI
jgi:hypothetical protein